MSWLCNTLGRRLILTRNVLPQLKTDFQAAVVALKTKQRKNSEAKTVSLVYELAET